MLVSFDVENLYGSIPPWTIPLLVNELLSRKKCNPAISGEMVKLFKVVIAQNYFLFNEKWYNQEEGLGMEKNTSSVSADTYIWIIMNVSTLCWSAIHIEKILYSGTDTLTMSFVSSRGMTMI